MSTTTTDVLTHLLDQIDTWRTTAAANRRLARPGHEAQQWPQLLQDLDQLRRRVRELLAHAQEENS